jgi:hypothetical protein
MSVRAQQRKNGWMEFNYTDDEGKIDRVQGMKAYGGEKFLIHVFLNLLTKWNLITSSHEPL